MNIINKKSTMTLALSAAAILATATTSIAQAAKEVKSTDAVGKCFGINECKGQTACQTADGACAGTNSCKGKGWLKASKSECDAKEGKFEALAKK